MRSAVSVGSGTATKLLWRFLDEQNDGDDQGDQTDSKHHYGGHTKAAVGSFHIPSIEGVEPVRGTRFKWFARVTFWFRFDGCANKFCQRRLLGLLSCWFFRRRCCCVFGDLEGPRDKRALSGASAATSP